MRGNARVKYGEIATNANNVLTGNGSLPSPGSAAFIECDISMRVF
jgi:hypothetical protein